MRTNTKERREASREIQFNSLLNHGFIRETYKGLEIFTDSKNLLLKVFEGTAANAFIFYKYRTAEQMAAKVIEVKQSYDKRQEWKAEQKEKNKGHKSGHAATAAAIRTELKAAFPSVKFSVTSEIFSGGDACRVSWENGPTTEKVTEYSNKYQSGHFNGMEDIYEYSNSRDDIPQVKYITESRSISPDILTQIQTEICALMDFSNVEGYMNTPEQIAYLIASKTDFPPIYESFKVVRNDKTSGSGFESFFYIEFVGVPEVKAQQQPNIKPVATGEEEIKVIEYSEKAVAIIGKKETIEPIREKIKDIGAVFNFRLSCGPAWILSKKKLPQLEAILTAHFNTMEPEQPAEDEKTTLKDEINKTVEYFAAYDLATRGEIQPDTLKIAEVQEYGTIQELEQAAKGGKMISLLNMSNLVNVGRA